MQRDGLATDQQVLNAFSVERRKQIGQVGGEVHQGSLAATMLAPFAIRH
jgi:hypothetical protein